MSKKILTAKEQRFVKAYSTGSITASDAITTAGYNTSSIQSSRSLATKMLRKDHIQQALADAIAADFPDIAKLSAQRIYQIIASDDSRPLEQLKAIEFLARVAGWLQPRESSTVTIQQSFALPEE